ncbi:MAG: hypothetical protein Q9173_000920 [Seirophora scorigena]
MLANTLLSCCKSPGGSVCAAVQLKKRKTPVPSFETVLAKFHGAQDPSTDTFRLLADGCPFAGFACANVSRGSAAGGWTWSGDGAGFLTRLGFWYIGPKISDERKMCILPYGAGVISHCYFVLWNDEAKSCEAGAVLSILAPNPCHLPKPRPGLSIARPNIACARPHGYKEES